MRKHEWKPRQVCHSRKLSIAVALIKTFLGPNEQKPLELTWAEKGICLKATVVPPRTQGQGTPRTVVRQEPKNFSPPSASSVLLIPFIQRNLLCLFLPSGKITVLSWPIHPEGDWFLISPSTALFLMSLSHSCPSPRLYGKAQSVPVWVPCWFSRGLMRVGHWHAYHSYAHLCIRYLVLTVWNRHIL